MTHPLYTRFKLCSCRYNPLRRSACIVRGRACRHPWQPQQPLAASPTPVPKPIPVPTPQAATAAAAAPRTPAAADAAAAAAAAAVRPAWTDLQPARALLPGLPHRALLHAGPPLPRLVKSQQSFASIPIPPLTPRIQKPALDGSGCPPAPPTRDSAPPPVEGAAAAALAPKPLTAAGEGPTSAHGDDPGSGGLSGGDNDSGLGGGAGASLLPVFPAPLLHSAVVAVLFEGWAQDEAAARRLVLEGGVQLLAAQDFRVVTPLACVVSPSMQLQVVEDVAASSSSGGGGGGSQAAAVAAVSYSPLQAGPPPAPRFGTLYDLHDHVTKLRRLHGPLAATLRGALRRGGPVELLPLAAASLAAGEECHAGTLVASAALWERLLPYLTAAVQRQPPPGPATESSSGKGAEGRPLPPPPPPPLRPAAAAEGGVAESTARADGAAAAEAVVAFLASAPSFFLNLWMAACKCALVAAEAREGDEGGGSGGSGGDGGGGGSTLVTALGGNGVTVGLQLSGRPGVWFTAPALPPEPYVPASPIGGAPLPPPPPGAAAATAATAATPCGAMGDSMVVDALGFGAQLQLVLPDPDANLYPDLDLQIRDLRRRRERAVIAPVLALAPHPGLPRDVLAATGSGTDDIGARPGSGFGSGSDPTRAPTAQQIKVGISARELLRLRSGAPGEEQEVAVEAAAEAEVGAAAERSCEGRKAPAAADVRPAPGLKADSLPSPLAVNLSVLDAAGELGIIGRGVYFVPVPLLEQALQAMSVE